MTMMKISDDESKQEAGDEDEDEEETMDDDVLRDGGMTMMKISDDESKQEAGDEDEDEEETMDVAHVYDAMVLSVEHPGDLKANSSGMMMWNIQNTGNVKWIDCNLIFVSGDA